MLQQSRCRALTITYSTLTRVISYIYPRFSIEPEIYYSEVGLETEKIANYVMKPSALPGIKEAH